MNFATVDDMALLWRRMTEEEQARAQGLLEIISDELRVYARRVGKNLDEMILEEPGMESIAKSVVVDICARALMTSTTAEPMSQISQSGLGYSASGTFLNPGGGLFIKKSELKRLGLMTQRIGVISPWISSRGCR